MSDIRQLKRDVRRLLAQLGDGRAEVAGALEAMGVRATPTSVRECAVARYLGVVLGADPRVRSCLVENTRVEVFTAPERTGRHNRPVRVRLPHPVRQFIRAFDRQMYPALIRTELAGAPHPSGTS
ncbi:MAG TPA: hypothetical protein VGL60_13885 [Acidimicrobiales bacterium]|jgi:hypothetical protein